MRTLLIFTSMLSFFSFASTDDYWETVFKNTEEARQRATQIHQPIEDAPTSSKFGMRFHPILSVDKMHRGVDFAADEGTPFKAAGKGVVLYAEERSDLGLTVAIEHSNGYVTRYGHASKLLVKAGDTVEDQMIIGLVGKTGMATNAHLHFETIRNGLHVDPTEITTLYDPNDNLTTLEDRINSLLSREQVETLEKSGVHLTPELKPTVNESSPIALEPVDEDPVPVSPNITSSNLKPDMGKSRLDTDAHVHQKNSDSDKKVESHKNSSEQGSRGGEGAASPSKVLSKNTSTWAIAQDMVANTDLTIFQALAAIYDLNSQSFKYNNIHLRTIDATELKLPTLEQISFQDRDSARERCYMDLEKLKLISQINEEKVKESDI